VQSVHVEGESMRPGLQNGQLLLINRAAYFHLQGAASAELLPDPAQGITRFMFGGPKRGDVVVFQASSAPDNELVKRIIGLPGESVRIEAGKGLVDNRLLDEPYAAGGVGDVERYPSDRQPITVPHDS